MRVLGDSLKPVTDWLGTAGRSWTAGEGGGEGGSRDCDASLLATGKAMSAPGVRPSVRPRCLPWLFFFFNSTDRAACLNSLSYALPTARALWGTRPYADPVAA